MALYKLRTADATRWAVGPVDGGPQRLLAPAFTLDAALAAGAPLREVVASARTTQEVGAHRLLAPVDDQDVWAAGVTYPRSRDARREESGRDVYDEIWEAERPELFFKARGRGVCGPGDEVGVRVDSGWDVPEPELALVVDAAATVVAYTIGDDVSSRSIEGDNPLYLPQAKTYDRSCALGPCLVTVDEAPPPEAMTIRLEVGRGGAVGYSDSVEVAAMHRSPRELVEWLFRCTSFPRGVVLLTGTAIVPPADFTLAAGDDVRITITGLGELRTGVRMVGG